MVTKGEREWGRDKLGFGISRYKLYQIDKQQGPTV